MSKIHVLPDEKLNGIPREYIEVERKANAGEKIIGKNTGNIYTVLNVFSSSIETDTRQHIHHQDYFVLEPTDIVRIDGERYRMVDRKANVGEKIIAIHYDIVSDLIVKPGDVLTVKEVDSDGVECVGGAYFCPDCFNDEYRVLVPLHTCDKCGEPLGELACSNQKGGSYCSVDCAKADDELTETTEASKSTIDLLTNLALRVTELERKLTEVDNKVEMTLDDIVTLDERTQPLVALTDMVFKYFASVALEHLRAVKDDG